MRQIFFACFLLIGYSVFSQDWVDRVKDDYYKKNLVSGLRVGDQMPDIPFGVVYNADKLKGKTRFSDLKGKLVILDFWSLNCASCIAGFPKMKKLQDEFGDKIQVMLVNVSETKEQAEKKEGKHFWEELHDLPSIFVDSPGKLHELWNLFPFRGIGDHAWIDGDGKIIMRGSKYNSYPEKIRDALAGKPFFALNNGSTEPVLDKTVPYYSLINDFKTTHVKFGSFITPFNNEYDPYGKGANVFVIDSVSGTKRFTALNREIIFLYSRFLYTEVFDSLRKKILYMPGGVINLTGQYIPLWILPKAALRYTNPMFIPENVGKGGANNGDYTAEDYVKSKICYEQVVPLNVTEEEQRKLMEEDLGRYLNNVYGAKISLQKIKMPCYILVRTSKVDKLTTKNNSFRMEKIIKNGKPMIQYFNTHFITIGIGGMKNKTGLAKIIEKNWLEKHQYFLLLDETGFDREKNIDIILPEDAKTMDDLRKALQPYDLDIKEAVRELPFAVITDNSGK